MHLFKRFLKPDSYLEHFGHQSSLKPEYVGVEYICDRVFFKTCTLNLWNLAGCTGASTNCPPGSQPFACGAAGCQQCGAGSYSSGGSMACMPCPSNSTSIPGSVNVSACIYTPQQCGQQLNVSSTTTSTNTTYLGAFTTSQSQTIVKYDMYALPKHSINALCLHCYSGKCCNNVLKAAKYAGILSLTGCKSLRLMVPRYLIRVMPVKVTLGLHVSPQSQI